LEVADIAATLIEERQTDICVVDKVGIGAGTVAALRKKQKAHEFQTDVRIFGFNGAEKARTFDDNGYPMFPNRRSEAWWNMRAALNPDTGFLALEANDLLRGDLSAPKYKYTGRNQIEVENKATFKKRLGRSPDYGDGAVYALDCVQWETQTPLLTETREARMSGPLDRHRARIPTLTGSDMPC
jgi:hypothetical protein